MNKRYTWLLLMSFAGVAQAQLARPMLLKHADAVPSHARPDSPQSELRGGGPIWSEDFANGLAGNNPSGAWTTDGFDGNIWKYNLASQNLVGAYTGWNDNGVIDERIDSDTPSNGWMVFNSDSANTNWDDTTIVADPINWDGSLVSPVIDLSATPAVELNFQQSFRWCCNAAPQFVDVTTNGFNTFATYAVDQGVAINTASGTITSSVPITGAINDDPSNVQFRFHHDGTTSASSHYLWQIDDVNITAAPAWNAHVFDGFVSHTGDGCEYGRIPKNQLGTEINIGGFFDNLGGQPLTNATITAVVVNDANEVQLTASASTPSLAPGDTLIMDEWPTLPDLAIGEYTVNYTASADSIASDIDPDNNTWVRTFEVTASDEGSTFFSLDQVGGHPPGTQELDYVGTDQFTGGTDDFYGFTYYKITEDLVVDAIEVDFSSGTQTGGIIRVAIHDSTAVVESDDPYSPFIESGDHEIVAQNISGQSKVSVPLSSPYILTAGSYYAGVVMFSNENADQIRIVDDITVPQPAWASAIHISGDATYSNGEALGIRLRHMNVSIAEHELAGVGVFPNPTEGIVNVTFTKPDNYLVRVTNVLGETVHTVRMNGTSVLDLGDLAKGVYNVHVSNADASTVQRVVLK